MPKHNIWLSILIILVVIGVPRVVMAGGPKDRIKATTDKLLTIITDPELQRPETREKRNRMIREAVDRVFDWEAFSRRALSSHWSERTPQEKREFISLFGDCIEQTYIDKTLQYSGEKVVFLNEIIDGQYGEVITKIITKNGKSIKVEYRVRKKEKGWFVYDIYVMGVSFVNNYRKQFNSIITGSSYEELVNRLRSKLVNG